MFKVGTHVTDICSSVVDTCIDDHAECNGTICNCIDMFKWNGTQCGKYFDYFKLSRLLYSIYKNNHVFTN
jgi:hypothetical protein